MPSTRSNPATDRRATRGSPPPRRCRSTPASSSRFATSIRRLPSPLPASLAAWCPGLAQARARVTARAQAQATVLARATVLATARARATARALAKATVQAKALVAGQPPQSRHRRRRRCKRSRRRPCRARPSGVGRRFGLRMSGAPDASRSWCAGNLASNARRRTCGSTRGSLVAGSGRARLDSARL